MITVLHHHSSPETACLTSDYPYGRYRTDCRWWLESPQKGPGKGKIRVMQQTKNPKTNLWNSPKPSVYNDFMVLYKDEKQHVHSLPINLNSPLGIFPLCSSGAFAQLNQNELDQLQEALAVSYRYNPNEWLRFAQTLSIARRYHSTDKVYQELIALRPNDPYVYQKDVDQIVQIAQAEIKFNFSLNVIMKIPE